MPNAPGNGRLNVSFTIIFYRLFTHSRGDATSLEGFPMQKKLRAMVAIGIFASAVGANTDLIVRVTSVCGVGGCAPVFTKRVQHPPAGFVQRAVPLAVPRPGALQPANPSK